jgi:hypothetical protein
MKSSGRSFYYPVYYTPTSWLYFSPGPYERIMLMIHDSRVDKHSAT